MCIVSCISPMALILEHYMFREPYSIRLFSVLCQQVDTKPLC